MNNINTQSTNNLPVALSVDVKKYIAASISENTKRAYKKWLAIFTAHGFVIPCTSTDVVSFLTTVKKADGKNYSAQSLNQCLAAIAYAHELSGAANPCNDPLVKTVFSGFKRVHGVDATRQAAAIRKEDIIENIKKPTSKIDVRNNALILIGFAGAFRRSELVNLEIKDLNFVPEGLIITMRKTKTNQEGIAKYKNFLYSDSKFCPIKALKLWLEISGIKEGKVFRNIKQNGSLGESITANSINLIVKKVFNEVETTEIFKVSAHSLRVGFITSADEAGVSRAQIKGQSHHESDKMVSHYTRKRDGLKNAVNLFK